MYQNNPRQSTEPPGTTDSQSEQKYFAFCFLTIFIDPFRDLFFFVCLEDRRFLNYIMESGIEAICLFLALVLLQVGHDPSRDRQPSACHDDAGDKLLLKQKVKLLFNEVFGAGSAEGVLKLWKKWRGKLCNIFSEPAPHSTVLWWWVHDPPDQEVLTLTANGTCFCGGPKKLVRN